MSPRFYVPNLSDADRVDLDGPEAHHLLHVLRLSIGETITLFDGLGNEAVAEIVGRTKRAAQLRILSRFVTPDTTLPLILATAVPKGERFRWLVEKATELGVRRLVPLETARSTVDPRESKLDKLRQTVIAACKQSGRSRLMEIAPVTDWRAFLESECQNRRAFIAHPTSKPVDFSRFRNDDPTILTVVAIGPEGGFTEEEIENAQRRGMQPLSLGPRLLRIETAAIALAALFGIVEASGAA